MYYIIVALNAVKRTVDFSERQSDTGTVRACDKYGKYRISPLSGSTEKSFFK